jgi:hypothetical protein
MSFEILKEQIEPPDQNNNVWVFIVRQCYQKKENATLKMRVGAFDLNAWVKEALGRYPVVDVGDKSKLKDLRENWKRIEPVLRKHLSNRVPY